MPQEADPYIDSSTGILRNLVGATSAQELDAFEVDLTSTRTIQVQANSLVAHTRDLAELQALHQHIFQDLYDWAGQIRTVDMRRGQGEYFAQSVGILLNAHFVFAELAERNHLQDLTKESFTRELTYFYDQVNHIHPFRDGNGRTQRLFWSRVAFEAGWLLDWRPIYGGQLDEASRAAREDGDFSGLESALAICISSR